MRHEFLEIPESVFRKALSRRSLYLANQARDSLTVNVLSTLDHRQAIERYRAGLRFSEDGYLKTRKEALKIIDLFMQGMSTHQIAKDDSIELQVT
jgi:hypothetical protein